MPPEPGIAPDLDQAKFAYTCKSRFKVSHDVLRPLGVFFRVNTCEEQPTWPQCTPELLSHSFRFSQMFEDIHRQDHIETRVGQRLLF